MDFLTKLRANFLIIYQQSINNQLQLIVITNAGNRGQTIYRHYEITRFQRSGVAWHVNNYFTINYPMQGRIRSAGTLMPQPQSILQKKRKQLEFYSKNALVRYESNNKNLVTPFTASSKRNHFAENIKVSMTPSPNDVKIDSISSQRPFTEQRYHRKLQSPLQVIRAKSKCDTLDLVSQTDRLPQNSGLKVNYLRKGSSIDRAIIINILKSKLNLNVCASALCYSDAAGNRELSMMLQNQIPKGIRDVVGVEEMMRMSHIMTGANFKSTSLTHKLNRKMKEMKVRKSSIIVQDDDHLTLKSIKRW